MTTTNNDFGFVTDFRTLFPEVYGDTAEKTPVMSATPAISETPETPETPTIPQTANSVFDFGGVTDIGSLFPAMFPEVFGASASESYNYSGLPEQPESYGYSPTVTSVSNPALPKKQPSANKYAVHQRRPETLPKVGYVPIERIRADFPILSEKVNGKDLVWLDNSATTQRPQAVIDRISYYYTHENSNVHRGAHTLAARSTDAYESARQKTADFIVSPGKDNIIFVRGTTEGLNLIAQSYAKPILAPGDEIILTLLEHHANIVPWQMIAEETGAVIRVAPIDESGQIILSEYVKLFNSRTKFVSAAHVSNTLGTITPIHEMISIAHGYGVRICVDGAQSVSHMPINVTAMDADFFVFSGHKLFAPNGIGVVYGKSDVLREMKPYQGGGNMIADVTFERTLYQDPPNKFEAGTGSIADAVGLGAAIDYLAEIGMANIGAYEHELLQYGLCELGKIEGLHLIGTAKQKASVMSFVMDNRSAEEIGNRLSAEGIALRAGHHCAQPVLRSLGLEATVRPSLAFYNTPGEIDFLVSVLKSIR